MRGMAEATWATFPVRHHRVARMPMRKTVTESRAGSAV